MGVMETQLEYLRSRKTSIENKLKELGTDIEKLKSDVPRTFFALKDKKDLKDIKAACILDQFSYDSYKEECILLQITPDGWKDEIDDFMPDLLFVESAWQGKDNLWYRKVVNISREYFELTSYCQEKGIPVVFWNKEDPVWTDTFIPAAKCADIVFTTDIDCIQKYKECLGNQNVFLLHFAAQPKQHNPIEKYERKKKFCFAGAYYHRYPKRAEIFDKFSDVFIELKGLDIYDRNYKHSRPEHAFPKKYDPYILGRLEPEEIDIAYKGYDYGINMNSVDQSQTMFARRVFEMLASNTVTVGNFSRGVKNFFGELTICTNDVTTLREVFMHYCGNEEIYRKYRLLGLRKALREHLYEDRLAHIVTKVFGVNLKKRLPTISLVMRVTEDSDRLIRLFRSFTYDKKMLYVIGEPFSEIDDENIIILGENEAVHIMAAEIADGGFIGNLKSLNYYGKNYLLDLSLSGRYSSAAAFGKAGYYQFTENGFCLKGKEHVYKQTGKLFTDRSIFSSHMSVIQKLSIKAFADMESIEDTDMLSIDEFNFCENFDGESCETVDDLVIVDQGMHMSELDRAAEKICADMPEDNGYKISFDEIYEYSKASWKDGVVCEKTNTGLVIESSLSEGQNKYVYLNKIFHVFEHAKEGKISLFFGGKGNQNLLGCCIFYDIAGKNISPVFPKPNVVSYFDVPDGAVTFKLGVRLYEQGSYTLQQIIIGIEKNPDEMSCFVSGKNTLVLSNYYPSQDNLYRNMFVHRRVKAYKDAGLLCDVMEWNSYSQVRYREFEQINIVYGQEEALFEILSHGGIRTVCIHFLDRKMWEVLKLFSKKVRMIVWVHGAEIQPWWRRKCNYRNVREEEEARKASVAKEKFWREIFLTRKMYVIQFVFVSHQFAEEVCTDYQIKLEPGEYSIIHNCIDTEMFSYRPKDPSQRKQILSIRPFAAWNYANDLTVKCILELSKRSFFGDLSFALYGDGILFEETVKPLRKFKNISINKKFLRQSEIAELHKQYGVFLVPTRLDTQGVSRDEAMASGLVTITNAVAAVPEFTDKNCAIVVSAEDYTAMADGIEELYRNPSYFLQLSENARKRIEGQTSKPYTIDKEIALICEEGR